jgi:hypothetical protein
MLVRRTLPFFLLIMAAALHEGCIISPQPEPPRISVEKISLRLISSDPDSQEIDTIVLTGAPGAVRPGGATLSVMNLDRFDVEEVVVTDGEGAFEVMVEGGRGDWLRLVAEQGSERSMPVFIVAGEEGPAAPAPRPLAECLVFTPGTELDFGEVEVESTGVTALIVRNRCAEAVAIHDLRFVHAEMSGAECRSAYESCLSEGQPTCSTAAAECENVCEDELRECPLEPAACEAAFEECNRGCAEELEACVVRQCEEDRALCEASSESTLGYAYDTELPLTVPVDEAGTITLTFTPARADSVEEVMLIHVASPEPGRWPITLTGEGVTP